MERVIAMSEGDTGISDCPVCGGDSEYVEHLGPTSLHRCETADCPVQTHLPHGGGDCNV
jgi:hypothetical protein